MTSHFFFLSELFLLLSHPLRLAKCSPYYCSLSPNTVSHGLLCQRLWESCCRAWHSLYYVSGSFPHQLLSLPKALRHKANSEHYQYCTCPPQHCSSSSFSTAPPNYLTNLFLFLHILALPPQTRSCTRQKGFVRTNLSKSYFYL